MEFQYIKMEKNGIRDYATRWRQREKERRFKTDRYGENSRRVSGQ